MYSLEKDTYAHHTNFVDSWRDICVMYHQVKEKGLVGQQVKGIQKDLNDVLALDQSPSQTDKIENIIR